jgi:hypothetical protein
MISKIDQPGSGQPIIEDDLTPKALDMAKAQSHVMVHRNQLDQSNEVDVEHRETIRGTRALREGEERG